jgi:hypothetical protein
MDPLAEEEGKGRANRQKKRRVMEAWGGGGGWGGFVTVYM